MVTTSNRFSGEAATGRPADARPADGAPAIPRLAGTGSTTGKRPQVLPPIPSPARPEGFKGRGASANPPNRFEPLHNEPTEDWATAEDPAPTTIFLQDHTSSLITTNDSPDLGFDASFNPYRGCEHGCIYCYARPTHEYLGMSAGLDFESRILVKTRAPELLRAELAAPSWRPRPLVVSGVTDCYQPVERRLALTRRCLEVLAEFRHPVSMITKNWLVVRDIDLLARLAAHRAAGVVLSVTTLDQELSLAMEPRASVPVARLAAIRALADAGIPVGVNVAPIIPGLTDHEVPAILQAAAEAGASFAGYTIVRLPLAVAPLFAQWLGEHVPLAKDKILHRIQQLRGGALNDPRFGSRMKGEGVFARQIGDLFAIARRKAGLKEHWPTLSTAAFMPPQGMQQSWLDDVAGG